MTDVLSQKKKTVSTKREGEDNLKNVLSQKKTVSTMKDVLLQDKDSLKAVSTKKDVLFITEGKDSEYNERCAVTEREDI